MIIIDKIRPSRDLVAEPHRRLPAACRLRPDDRDRSTLEERARRAELLSEDQLVDREDDAGEEERGGTAPIAIEGEPLDELAGLESLGEPGVGPGRRRGVFAAHTAATSTAHLVAKMAFQPVNPAGSLPRLEAVRYRSRWRPFGTIERSSPWT
ncbi:hypothetical protein Htur_2031 [Haloterrigena turkmenica DSM 5511]|uniref:Uncharacterized protein n=1 Tax=Haloterrigena turkmenica (strain ATCC 51198 / DSM 5511 / JCM 9101 / NCIMB 13204 / VKM B-1734 / 4k) TaxID=543526 RepID=D2RT35_HALTV|nr:hypothetical protein [Haloterrigena turkmenica]ADB60915.1 hypothetical protein Htur_2031 [Haloterrigena turkmenica DSM 5511]